MEGAYRVEVRRNGGQGWTVTVAGVEGVGGFMVADLSDVEAKARRHVFGWTGRPVGDVEVDVHVVIPADIEQRFEVAEQMVQDAGEELGKAAKGLFDIGCVPQDVRWLVNHRPLAFYVMATEIVSDSELAEHGLENHPHATGLRWSDNGFAETVRCRRCVEASRDEYARLADVGSNVVLFGDVDCDFCNEGYDDREAGPGRGADSLRATGG